MKRFILFLFLFFASPCWASTYYVSQNGGSGANCCSGETCQAYTWFNTSGNYHAGDTINICGTMTQPLMFQATGTNGNPITLYFQPGAMISMPACPSSQLSPGGCIDTNGNTYLLIDGGTTCGWVNHASVACNGIIQSTLNGTSGGTCPGGTCTTQAWANGIKAGGCTGCEIRNLLIQNMYVRTSYTDTAGDGFQESGIQATGSNLLIHNNTIHDCSNMIWDSFGNGDTNVQIYNNETYHGSHNFTLSATSGSSAGGNFYFHDNHTHFANNDSYSPWDEASTNNYHKSAIHSWGTGSGSTWSSVSQFWIYNNLFDQPSILADTSAGCSTPPCMSGWVFLEGNPQSGSYTPWNGATGTAYVFNNIAIGHMLMVANGTGHVMTNNTVANSPSATSWISAGSPTNFPCTATIENNYMSGSAAYQGGTFTPTNYSGSSYIFDYNLYANLWGYNLWDYTSATGNFTSYLAQSGNPWDAHSINDTGSSPYDAGGISQATGVPSAGADTIGKGTNLTPLATTLASSCTQTACTMATTAMKSDIAGTSRPSSGSWDIGAFSYAAGVSSAVSTPAKLIGGLQ
jgi:hypothetical protein